MTRRPPRRSDIWDDLGPDAARLYDTILETFARQIVDGWKSADPLPPREEIIRSVNRLRELGLVTFEYDPDTGAVTLVPVEALP